MYVHGERSTVQWRLQREKPCSNYGIIDHRHVMETKNNFINTDHKKVPQLPIDQYGARQSQVCPTKNEVGHI